MLDFLEQIREIILPQGRESVAAVAACFIAEWNDNGATVRDAALNAEEALQDAFHDDVLRRLQNELFDLGSELATPADAVYEGMFRFSEQEVKALERLIDQCQKELEPLKSFILPGGGRIGGFLHQCRTLCRRAERDILALSREETLNPHTLKYVNRLSDLFFVLSRWVGKRLGEKEYLWERGLQARPRKKRASS